MTDTPESGPVKKPPPSLGKYEIGRVLGRGGMGVVYEAVDTQLNRKVALKLLLPSPHAETSQAEAERQRFVREAQLSAQLKHPNIVTVYEAGVLKGRMYIAMELLQGQPFSKWCAQKGVTLPQKLAVLRDVALAVQDAHEKGVLHRDLKPENILVDADRRPVVMDFGLAKVIGANTGVSITNEGFSVGTPAYMSPEQAQGSKNVDVRTDVYSLGVMLYEVLAGRKPYEGQTVIEVMMKASKGGAQPPSSSRVAPVDPLIDKSLESISMKALEKNPKDRYPSARAFAQDLDRWMKGESVRVVLTHNTRRLVRPARQSRVWIFAAAATPVVVAGIILFLALRSSPSAEADLARARRFMEEKRYAEALVEFGKSRAIDPSNTDASDGVRQAREAIERERQEKERQEEEKRGHLARELLAAQQRSEEETRKAGQARLEAERQAREAANAASETEQKRLLEKLKEVQERAWQAEEEARKAREQLEAQRMAAAASPSSPPATKPEPEPVKPQPPPAPPAPPPAPKPVSKEEAAALREVRDAAIARLDFAAAFAAIDAMAAAGAEGDPIAARAAALKAGRKAVRRKEDLDPLLAAHIRAAEDALEADDFTAGPQMAKDALPLAKQAGDTAAAERAAALGKEFQARRPLYDRYAKSRKTLAENPNDPAANSDAGRYLCLVKEKWAEGLPLLARGSDETLRTLADQEVAKPKDPAGQIALGEGWWNAARKESNETLKARAAARALRWFEDALPGLGGLEKMRVEKRIDECLRLAPLETHFTFVSAKSMKPYPTGYQQGGFPVQKTTDPAGPFRGEPVYFDQRTGTDVVYEVRSGRSLRHLYWKGAAMTNMTFEVQDWSGNVVARGGPWAGGNTWAEFNLDFPPSNRFILRLRNHVSTWYLIDTLTLR
jgi:predicted Ser/Thr protein kinase